TEPTVDGGAQVASFEVSQQIEDLTDTRLTALRTGDKTSGIAAGAPGTGTSLWIQGYGEDALQDERDLVPGYRATIWGSAVGMDTRNILDDGILGLALNYGQANVNSRNANTTATNVDNYGLTFYGTINMPKETYLEGQAGYAYNKIDST